jgi:hypothetical protein
MPGSWLPTDLPNLTADNHTVTSPVKNRYNCIGWAAGSDTQWWWPIGRYHWPPNVPRELTVEAFVQAYGTIGYVECEDGSLEANVEKIAIFATTEANGDLVPTHAARQLADGRWTSKLGPLEDIEHSSVANVCCPVYGDVVCYLKRPH